MQYYLFGRTDIRKFRQVKTEEPEREEANEVAVVSSATQKNHTNLT